MNKVIVRAPVRADLAGGTLDLWPLYLFHPSARTVNVAISYYAESEVAETGTSDIEIHLTDQQYKQRYTSLQEMAADPKAALLHRALEHFRLTGIKITVRGEVEGLDEAGFLKAAETAKDGCPVSKALTGVEITLDAALES